MAENHLAVTPGNGQNLRTFNRTVSSTSVDSQYVILDDPGLPTYIGSISTAQPITATGVIAGLMAGSSLNVRIRRITFQQFAPSSGAGTILIDLRRITAAGTGTNLGTNPLDSGDSSAGASLIGTYTVAPTLGARIGLKALPVTTAPTGGNTIEWRFDLQGSKALIIPSGTANGLALNLLSTTGTLTGATGIGEIEFVETSW